MRRLQPEVETRAQVHARQARPLVERDEIVRHAVRVRRALVHRARDVRGIRVEHARGRVHAKPVGRVHAKPVGPEWYQEAREEGICLVDICGNLATALEAMIQAGKKGQEIRLLRHQRVDRVFSAPSHRVMGMLAMGYVDRVEVPVSELHALPKTLFTEAEKTERAAKTKSIPRFVHDFSRRPLPRKRAYLQAAT